METTATKFMFPIKRSAGYTVREHVATCNALNQAGRRFVVCAATLEQREDLQERNWKIVACACMTT